MRCCLYLVLKYSSIWNLQLRSRLSSDCHLALEIAPKIWIRHYSVTQMPQLNEEAVWSGMTRYKTISDKQLTKFAPGIHVQIQRHTVPKRQIWQQRRKNHPITKFTLSVIPEPNQTSPETFKLSSSTMLGMDLNRARKLATCIRGKIFHQCLVINTSWKEWQFLLINGFISISPILIKYKRQFLPVYVKKNGFINTLLCF